MWTVSPKVPFINLYIECNGFNFDVRVKFDQKYVLLRYMLLKLIYMPKFYYSFECTINHSKIKCKCLMKVQGQVHLLQVQMTYLVLVENNIFDSYAYIFMDYNGVLSLFNSLQV